MIFNQSGKSFFGQNIDEEVPGHLKESTRDIGAILYAQCAKGAFKMGMYESCDKYLMKCLEERSQSDNQE